MYGNILKRFIFYSPLGKGRTPKIYRSLPALGPHVHLDGIVIGVPVDLNVVHCIVVDGFMAVHDGHGRKRLWFSFQLYTQRGFVVVIDVCIANDMYQFMGHQTAMMGQQVRQEGVRGDIERNTQTDIATALVQGARQAISLTHVKLAQDVAGGQRHFVQLTRIPCRHDHASRGALGRIFQHGDEVLQLVDATSLVI